MIDRWIRDSITSLKSAMERFRQGREGDFKQAIIIADHAIESIMRNYLIFVHNINPPYSYGDLLDEVAKKSDLSGGIIDTIRTFRLIRDGFHHHNIKKLEDGLRKTTTGLTLEKSYLEEYLEAVGKLIEHLAHKQI